MLKNKENLTDNELILKIREEQNSDAMSELIDRYSMVFNKATHQYHKSHPETRLADLLDELYIVFNRAIDTYKFNKRTKLSTWIYYHTRWNCLNLNKNTNKSYSMEVSDIDNIQQSQNKYHNFESNVKDMNDYLFKILSQLQDTRISEIFKLRYIVGGKQNKFMSWAQVAKQLSKKTGVSISISHVIGLHSRGKKLLAAKINGNNNFDAV